MYIIQNSQKYGFIIINFESLDIPLDSLFWYIYAIELVSELNLIEYFFTSLTFKPIFHFYLSFIQTKTLMPTLSQSMKVTFSISASSPHHLPTLLRHRPHNQSAETQLPNGGLIKESPFRLDYLWFPPPPSLRKQV